MSTRVIMISIALVTAMAIAVVWTFPRTRASIPAPSSSSGEPAARAASSAPRRTGKGDKPSPACLECQKRECSDVVDGCHAMEGTAAAGPAAGKPRKELCEKMLDCARQTGCDSYVSLRCYCGDTDLNSCLEGKGKGECRQAVEAAAETEEPGAVFKHLKDKTFASGVVEPLLTCETRACKVECVPYYQ
jgi:hypothetical protein